MAAAFLSSVVCVPQRLVVSASQSNVCCQDNALSRVRGSKRQFFGALPADTVAPEFSTCASFVTVMKNQEESEEASVPVSSRRNLLFSAAAAASLFASPKKAHALNHFADATDGYEVDFPNGWIQYPYKPGGPDVAYRDLINQDETVSVLISPIDRSKSLESIGEPEAVGKKLAAVQGDELKASTKREKDSVTYYDFEFQNKRLNKYCSVAASRGKLYTLTLTASQKRWPKVKGPYDEIVKKFKVYDDPLKLREKTGTTPLVFQD